MTRDSKHHRLETRAQNVQTQRILIHLNLIVVFSPLSIEYRVKTETAIYAQHIDMLVDQ